MAVYRFRVTFEDPEDVFREIDIQGKQTFEDFHHAIQEAISFDNSKDASFFMSDDFWKKGQEITLRPRPEEDDDDDDFRRNPKPQPRVMNKSRIVEFIDDPHQKIIYIFDPQVQWTFFIELVRIVNEEPKTIYPKCTKNSGAAPKQYKQVIAPPVDDDEFDDEEEDDGPKKEKVFLAEEEYDADEKVGDDSEEESDSEESEGGESEEGGDDAIEPSGFDEDL